MMYRIAIVDDSCSDCALLKEFIQKYAKENNIEISLKECVNGMEFLDFPSERFDIVFLDIRMPLPQI